MILHFCCIMTVVLGEGWLLGWYESVTDMLSVGAGGVIVYLAVWIITRRVNKNAADGMNRALKNLNSDEEA